MHRRASTVLASAAVRRRPDRRAQGPDGHPRHRRTDLLSFEELTETVADQLGHNTASIPAAFLERASGSVCNVGRGGTGLRAAASPDVRTARGSGRGRQRARVRLRGRADTLPTRRREGDQQLKPVRIGCSGWCTRTGAGRSIPRSCRQGLGRADAGQLRVRRERRAGPDRRRAGPEAPRLHRDARHRRACDLRMSVRSWATGRRPRSRPCPGP